MTINTKYFADTQLDVLLDEVCKKLQLDATRRQMVETSYNYVTNWIEDDDEFFKNLKPELFAYGSYAIGTTTKPLSRDEFDLDFVVMVIYDYSKIAPEDFINRLYERLKKNKIYTGKLEKLRFCVRIKYDRQFHLDIMPGCQIPNRPKKLLVPDTKRNYWAIRNPKGYIKWFKGRFITDMNLLRLYESKKMDFIAKVRAAIGKTEELPQAVPYEFVQPLQKSVQLLKRYRDIYFEKTPELATSSIILTTLAGRFYQQEVSIYDSLDGIIQRIHGVSRNLSPRSYIEITNPADDNENEALKEKFSDKWKEKPELYNAFIEFIDDVRLKWEVLKNEQTKQGKVNILRQLFGENIGNSITENEDLWQMNNRATPPQPTVKNKTKLAALASRQKPWKK